MSKSVGYSLWLVPDRSSSIYQGLTSVIAEIADRYSAPIFHPHVTLLGGLIGLSQVVGGTRKLADMIMPLEIQLGDIRSHGTYFQLLFSKVERTEAVMCAYAKAQAIFGAGEGEYFPHLSLAYGDIPEADLDILLDLIPRQPGFSSSVGRKFVVSEIELWRTRGAVEDWRRVTTFPMGKAQAVKSR